MKKPGYLILVGTCLIIAGIIIILTNSVGVNIAKIIVPLLFLISGIYCIKSFKTNRELEVSSTFQLIKGIGLIGFALAVSFFSNSLLNFLMLVTYFMLMYGLLDIVFPFAVLNSKNKVSKKIIVYGAVSGLTISVGALIILFTTTFDKNEGLIAAGILTVLIGISNIIYAAKQGR